MIRITLMDGSSVEMPREQAKGLLPFAGVFASPLLRAPIEGVICHQGKPMPLLGPLPLSQDDLPVNERAWILLLADHAQVIRGLPNFGAKARASETDEEEDPLLKEFETLLETA
jgi:hypothetical protein